jgi:uncharacterized protein (DUF2062 family)
MQRLREIFSKKTLNKIVEQLYNPNQSDEIKACAAALGIFVGIIPVWGVQTLLAIFFAWLFKLNKTIVLVFSQVSLPPFMPLVIFLCYRSGSYWIKNDGVNTANGTKTAVEQYIYGSITLAIAGAIVTGALTLLTLKLIKIFKQYNATPKLKRAV